MSWVTVGVTAGTMIMGGVQADEQQRAQKKRNLAAAEHNRYSNWTGRTMEQQYGAPSVMGGALQGGLAGFGASRGFLNGGGGAANPSGGGNPYSGIAGKMGGSTGGSAFGMQDTEMKGLQQRGIDPRVKTLFD